MGSPGRSTWSKKRRYCSWARHACLARGTFGFLWRPSFLGQRHVTIEVRPLAYRYSRARRSACKPHQLRKRLNRIELEYHGHILDRHLADTKLVRKTSDLDKTDLAVKCPGRCAMREDPEVKPGKTVTMRATLAIKFGVKVKV